MIPIFWALSDPQGSIDQAPERGSEVAGEQEQEVGIKVDANRVIEKLKRDFASQLADLKHQLATYEVALEDAVNDRNEAEVENRRLKGGSVKPPGE